MPAGRSERLHDLMISVHRILSTVASFRPDLLGEWASSSDLTKPEAPSTGPSRATLERVKVSACLAPEGFPLVLQGHQLAGCGCVREEHFQECNASADHQLICRQQPKSALTSCWMRATSSVFTAGIARCCCSSRVRPETDCLLQVRESKGCAKHTGARTGISTRTVSQQAPCDCGVVILQIRH